MTVSRFEDLRAWQSARQLANAVYDASDEGAFSRDFGLKDQIRRAAVSVMSNVSEGFESRTQKLFVDFLGRAKASAGEVRSQLYLALDRGYVDDATVSQIYDLADMCSRQIHNLMDYLGRYSASASVREVMAQYTVSESDSNPATVPYQ